MSAWRGKGREVLHTCIAPGSCLLLLRRVAEGVRNLVHVPSVCGHGLAKEALCKRTRVHEDLAEANVLFKGQGDTTEHSGDKRGRERYGQHQDGVDSITSLRSLVTSQPPRLACRKLVCTSGHISGRVWTFSLSGQRQGGYIQATLITSLSFFNLLIPNGVLSS